MKCFTILAVAAATVFYSCLAKHSVLVRDVTINFNTLMDTVLESIQEDASAYGLDPFNMGVVTKELKLGFIRGHLALTDGKIYGANTIFRYDNAIAVINDEKMGNVTIELGIRNLTYTTDYSLNISFVHANGKAHGDMTGIYADVVLLADFKNSSDVTATLKSFKITSVGSITAHLVTGNAVSQAIENGVIDVVLSLFKKRMVSVIQEDFASALNSSLVGRHLDMSG